MVPTRLDAGTPGFQEVVTQDVVTRESPADVNDLTGVRVGILPATRRILADTPLTETVQWMRAELDAAAGEWEGLQIGLRPEQPLIVSSMDASDLACAGGSTVSNSNIRLYRQWYVNVTDPSPGSMTFHERRAGLYPDPLIPFGDPYHDDHQPVGVPFTLDAGATGAIYVDWYLPPDTPPGTCTGKLDLHFLPDGHLPIELAVYVYDFALPQERTVATAFGTGTGGLRHFHGGPTDPPDKDLGVIGDRYFQALHEHRLDPTNVSAPIDFQFEQDGTLKPVDWTGYDAAVGRFLDGTLFEDGVGVARFSTGWFEPGRGTGIFTPDQYSRAAEALALHLEAKGWLDHAYIYAIDEPWLEGGAEAQANYAQINADYALLTARTDLWRDRVMVTGPYHAPIADSVGIWCPDTVMYEDWCTKQPGREEYAPLLAAGKSLWFYACLQNRPPYAGFDIDTAIGYEPRIMMWGAWYERASGFLYWRTTHWAHDDPWNYLRDVDSFKGFARTGDGFLFYPGDHHGDAGGKGSPQGVSIDGPIVSLRMKQARDGMEDWEMFKLAESLGAGDFVRRQVERAYTRFGDSLVEACGVEHMYCPDDQPWTLDEQVLLDARRQVALKVQYLLNPGKYPDPEGTTPSEPAPEAVTETVTDAVTETATGPEAVTETDTVAETATEASGGAGCATGGSTSASIIVSLLILAVVALRRSSPGAAAR
jgi:hypothetical protein